ncbi:hypothetical protein ACM26V_24750 [Salipaludibacillus sp. HK11]|uniref:hypothetical protein n=1 Tax=Salipaludibacillus sp. HK11 TaxID=3394320 RepID=UPI0039FD748A
MNQKTKCDECEKTFMITRIKKENVGLNKGERVVFYYIQCPHCKKKYLSHVESTKVKRLIEKVKKRQNNIKLTIKSKIPSEEKEKLISKNRDEIKELQTEARVIQEDLKSRFALR